MRLLLVNRFFGFDAPTGRILRDVADRLAADGHDVVVLATSGGHFGSGAENGVSGVPKVDLRLIGQSRAVPRLLNWVWFWIQSVIRVPFMRWDRCLLLTDPPFLLLAGWLPKLIYGDARRVYWWTMDLYPEALDAAGIVSRKSLLYRILHQCVELGLQATDGVIMLGHGQHRRLREYRRWRHVNGFSAVIPPWENRLLPKPVQNANTVIKRFAWEGRKIALYAGNLGVGHSFEEFLEGARYFASAKRDDWLFVFVVRGTGVAALEKKVATLPNVRVMDYLPEAETPQLLWSAVVHLISMKPGWEGISVPSKLYGSIKTEAPVLFIGPDDSDIAEELRRLRRGKLLPSGAEGAIVAAALDEMSQPSWKTAPVVNTEGIRKVAEFFTGSDESAIAAGSKTP